MNNITSALFVEVDLFSGEEHVPYFLTKGEARGSISKRMERMGVQTPGNYRGTGFNEAHHHEHWGGGYDADKAQDKYQRRKNLRMEDYTSAANAMEQYENHLADATWLEEQSAQNVHHFYPPVTAEARKCFRKANKAA